ncbi:MAG: dihydrolipoyl dehydrogenase [Bacillota bacterium]
MYDIVVIGGGPGGYVAAIRAAQLGAKVACVEAVRVGGTCLNRGCIPTKTLVRSAEILENCRHASKFGVNAGEASIDMPAVIARKNQVVANLTGGVEKLFKAYGVEFFPGRASVPSPDRVVVALNAGGTETLATKHIILATGSKSQLPPLPKEQLALTISSDEALNLQHVPESMLVIGGGVLGIEFACIYNAFGAKVTAIKRTPLILPPIDPEISQRLALILKRQGITINTGVYMREIFARGGKKVLTAEQDGKPVEYEVDTILVAMGRVPEFGGIDLDALGVAYDKSGIKVDEWLRTSVPTIYAIGDCVGKFMLAPVASAEGVAAVEHAMGHPRKLDYSVVPNCVFSHPEVASVGLTETQAQDKGFEPKVSKFLMSANGRALAIGQSEGVVKLVADAKTGKVLGLHILGPFACDLIHEGSIALKTGAKAEDLSDILVHAHPTLSETVMEAAHGVHGDPIHMAPRRR